MQVRCLHCHEPMEVAEHSDFSSLVCASCGGTFSLVGEQTVNYQQPAEVQSIGHFELLERVGVGSFGSVWKARDTELHRIVAIKIPRKGDLEPHEADQFLREARAAAQLHHPNIVGVHEVGRDGDSIYIVNDFVNGASLSDWLTGQQLSAREAVELCAKVADALHHAHEAGIVHRDLKPGNILLDLEREPHLTDFGLARRTAADATMTVDGHVIGTPAYMCPEQARGDSHLADRRADVYSLGVVLYKLLTGELPFRGSPQMLLVQIQREEPPSPRKLNSHIPRDLETICLKCLEKHPDRRYQTAAELAAELRRWLNGEPILARPVGATARAWRWSRRNPALALASSLAALAMMVALALSISFAIQQSRAADRLRREQQQTQDALIRAEEQGTLANERSQALSLQLARGYLQRGQLLCDQGEVAHGLLWMTRSLETLPPDHADLERVIRLNLAAWRSHLSGLVAILPHEKRCTAVAFSPDGSTVVSAGDDHIAQLWNATTGEPIGGPWVHSAAVRAVAYAPGGKSVLTGDADGVAQLWDVASGQPAGPPLRHHGEVSTVAVSPDGETLLTGGHDRQRTAQLWRAFTGEPIGAPLQHGESVHVGMFSPSGRIVATAGWDKTARLWNAATGEAIGEPLEHESPILSCAFSPDETRVLTGTLGGVAQLWDVVRGEPVGQPIRHAARIEVVAFSPDGTLILTASDDRTARLWNAMTGEPVGDPAIHQVLIRAAAFRPDGRAFVTGSDDHTARLWDTATGRPIGATLLHQAVVRSVAFSPDGSRVLTGSFDHLARLWDVPHPDCQSQATPGPILRAIFSPDRTRILVIPRGQENVVQVWDTATATLVGEPLRHLKSVMALDVSPDGTQFLTGGFDALVQIRDAATLQPVGPPLIHESPVNKAKFSPDGRMVLTGCIDTSARLWDLATRRVRGKLMPHQGQVFDVGFSPRGDRLVTAADDQAVRLWDATTGDPLLSPLRHDGMVQAAVFSPDGTTVLTAAFNRTARLWDAQTGAPIGEPFAHLGPVNVVAFAPDGRTILTGSYDRTARLWDVATSLPIGPAILHDGAVMAGAFSLDGARSFTISENKLLQICTLAAPLAGDVERISLWSQVITGMELSSSGTLRALAPKEWEQRRGRLSAVGGPPAPGPGTPRTAGCPTTVPGRDGAAALDLANWLFDHTFVFQSGLARVE